MDGGRESGGAGGRRWCADRGDSPNLEVVKAPTANVLTCYVSNIQW
jgi:hypothetical protein